MVHLEPCGQNNIFGRSRILHVVCRNSHNQLVVLAQLRNKGYLQK